MQLTLPNNTVLLVNSDNYDAQATIVNAAKLKHYHGLNSQHTPTLSLGQLHDSLVTEAQ